MEKATDAALGLSNSSTIAQDVGPCSLQEIEDLSYTEAEDKVVLRKVDCHLLPLLMGTYLIQYLDKTCIAYSALWGLQEEANLKGNQYSWLTTIFYLGYLVGEFPMNFLFQKFHITKTCGILIFLWGSALICMAAADNFRSLLAVRFLLGVFESGVTPCFVQLTSMFYKRKEQPLRTSAWFCMNGVAQVVGGLVALRYTNPQWYAIGHIHADVASYKLPFLIFGALTIVWSIPFFLLAAPNPESARWLTPREKTIALKRVLENRTGMDNKKFKLYQMCEALTDIKVWVLALFVIANCIPNGAITTFGPLIIKGFGFSELGTTLLGMPMGGTQIMALLISGLLASVIRHSRIGLMCGGLAISIIGMSLMYALPNNEKIGRLLGYYIAVGFSAAYTLSLGLIQANVAGRTKKTVVTSILFISYCVGNLIGPQLFFEGEAPKYASGFIAIIVCLVADIALLCALFFLYARENAKRDRVQSAGDVGSGATDTNLDLTDMEDKIFRYAL